MPPVPVSQLSRNAQVRLIALPDSGFVSVLDTQVQTPGIHIGGYSSEGDQKFSWEADWEAFRDGANGGEDRLWFLGKETGQADTQGVLLSLDHQGNKRFQTGYNSEVKFVKIAAAPDGGFGLIGYNSSNPTELFVCRADSEANLDWNWKYQQSPALLSSDSNEYDLLFLPSGRMVLCFSTDRDSRILLLDENGERQRAIHVLDSTRLLKVRRWGEGLYFLGQKDTLIAPVPLFLRSDTLLSAFTQHILPFAQFSFTAPLMDCDEQGNVWISWGFQPSVINPFDWIFARFASDLSLRDHFTLSSSGYPGNTLASDQVALKNGNLLVAGRLENPQLFDEDLFLMSVDSLNSSLCWLNPSFTGWQTQGPNLQVLAQPGNDGPFLMNPDSSYSSPRPALWMDSLVCGTCSQAPRIDSLGFSLNGGLEWHFSAQVGGLPEQLLWLFGDGDSSVAHLPRHRYAQPGTYQVCLIASNACGSDTFCLPLTVSCPPLQAQFTWSGTFLNLNFSDLSSGNPHSWEWDFGDGNQAFIASPQHTYNQPGTYQVCLTVDDSCTRDTFCDSLSVLVGRDHRVKDHHEPGLYPQPVSDVLHINVGREGIERLRFFSLQGKLLLERGNLSHSEEISLDLAAFAPGIYLIELSGKRGNWSKKVLKL